jgi:hypothetical protein
MVFIKNKNPCQHKMCLQGRIIRGTTLVRFSITIEAFKADIQLFP